MISKRIRLLYLFFQCSWEKYNQGWACKDIKMPVHSYSSLSTFEKCPRLYKFIYIDKIPREEGETIEAFMGSRVHETLRKLYQDLTFSKLNTLDEVLEFYQDSWKDKWSDDVRIVKKYTAENYYKTGAKCIADYYNSYKPFNQSTTLGLERMIEIELEDYRLRGFIDRLAQGGSGDYEIHDYKTSHHLPTHRSLLENRQLALYQIGVENTWKQVKKIDLVWHYLIHDKEVRVRLRPEEIARVKAETVSLIERLVVAVDEDDFPAVEGKLCPWCSYQPLCPNYKHLIKTSDISPNKYLQEPGVKLVNEYERLLEKKRKLLAALEEELKQLKKAIIAFAEREGIEVICGSTKRLRVKKVSRVMYPSKKEAERKELDELLKEAGVWMDVSELNPYSLNRALAEGELSRELAEKIMKYQRLEESYKIYMSSMKK
jgi:putative RecB family exonuclease